MDSQRLARICKNLTLPIPAPARKKPKPQQSWQQLKPGQWLRLKIEIYSPRVGKLLIGSLVQVSGTDSLGMGLTPITDQGSVSGSVVDEAAQLRWTNKDWKVGFEKVRRTSKRRSKSSE